MLPPPVGLSYCQNIPWQATSKHSALLKQTPSKHMEFGGYFCSDSNLVITTLEVAAVMWAVLYRTTPSLPPYPFLREHVSVKAELHPPGHKWRQTNQGIVPRMAAITHSATLHTSVSEDDSSQNSQTKHKATSPPSVSLSLGLIQKPPKELQGQAV